MSVILPRLQPGRCPSAGGKDGFVISKVGVSKSEAGLDLTVISLDAHGGALTLKAERSRHRARN